MKFRCCSILLGLTMLILAGCGGGMSSTPQTTQPSQQHQLSARTSGGAVPTPASGAYFGAWVSPDGPNPSPSQQLQETETLESSAQLNRVLDTHMHYYDWPNLPNVSSDPSITDQTGGDLYVDNGLGRIPVISWHCPSISQGYGGLDAINNGSENGTITSAANAIKNLGKPVLLRFFWEFNENVNGGTANGDDCFSTTEVGNLASEATVFKEAWVKIWTIFQQNSVTNVAWLWNPAAKPNTDGTFGSTNLTMAQLASFFPTGCSIGVAKTPCVDWIGDDAYDKPDYLANPLPGYPDGFESLFGPFYSGVQGYSNMAGLPFAIVETGETPCNNPSANVSAQNKYLNEARTDLKGGAYPLIKAFMYFDEQGAPKPSCQLSNWDWQLLPTATPTPNGFTAWKNMGHDSYFNTR